MKEIIKKKWFMAIVVVLAAGSIFLVSFGISRSWTGKVAGKEDMQVAEQKKQEKEKFINKNIKDEKAKEIIKLQDKINEAEKNGKNPDEAIDQDLRAYNYTEDYKRYIELPEEEKEKLEVIPREQEIDEKEFDVIKEEQDENLGELTDDNKEEIIPEKFDLRDKIDIKVENQESFGLCWDFASNSALETNLALTKGQDYDFSEIHVDYMTSKKMNSYVDRQIHKGGNFEYWLKYVTEREGLVLQDKFDYRDYSDDELTQFFNVDTEDIIITKVAEFPDFTEENVGKEKFEEYQSIVKRHIMNYGGINAAIHYDHVPDVFNNDNEEYSNHEICVIGWDDNYSRENFKDKNGQSPKENGAYIALNSHGTDSGYNGYLYISYEDKNVNKAMYGIVSTDLSDAIPLSKINNGPIENFVRQNCNIIYDGDEEYVLDAEINKITILDLSNTDLTSLEGIEYFKYVINVNISNNNITDLTPITKLEKIMVLNASNNNIKDASVLAECPSIYAVNLSGNKNITGYEQCENIRSLKLSDCNLTSVESINKLTKLYSLDISKNCNIEDLDKLNMNNLSLLSLSDCNISNIKAIVSSYAHFSTLDLSYNNIQSLEDFIDCNAVIYELDLSGNKQIENFKQLNECSVNALVLRDCNITSFEQLPTENNEIFSIDVSNNNIGSDYEALKSMKYLTTLIMQNCNLEDISDIKKAGSIRELDLSYNPNVRGDLRGIPLEYIKIYDCNIENTINTLKMENERELIFNTNGIINEETLKRLPANIIVTGVTIEKTISIPNDKTVYLYTSELVEEGNKTRIDGINDNKCSLSIPVKLDVTNDNISSITARINYQNIKINFVKENNLKPREIQIAMMPNNINSINDELFDTILFEEKYDNGVYVPLENYELWYDKDNIHQGSNYIRISADDLKKEFYINMIGEDKRITLKFEDYKLYSKTVEFCDKSSWLYGFEKVERDDNSKTIKITKEMKSALEYNGAIQSEFTIPYESLYDLKALQGLDLSSISIEFSKDTSVDAKITEADLEQFKKIFRTRVLGIYDYNEYTFKKDRIVAQGEFVVDYTHKVGPKTEFVEFSDRKTYDYIKERFEDNIYSDYEEYLMLALTKEQIEILSNEGLTIPFESIEADIYSLSRINLHSLTIEFSEDTYEEEIITEDYMELLSQIENLETLYLVDNSGTRTAEDLIVDQNKYTVYFNGELYYEKTDEIIEEENIEPTDMVNNEINMENEVINIEDTNNIMYNTVIE